MGLAGGELAPADDAADRAVRGSGRAGFAARSVLYVLVGVLALRLATGGGSSTEASQQGAMAELASRPFGGTLLAVLALGLVGYAGYRAVQAVRGDGDGGVVQRRVVPAVRAVVYLGMAALAVRQLAGAGERTDESSVTAAVLGQPGGRWVVAALGLVIVGVGIKQFVEAWRGDTEELAGPADVPARGRRAVRVAGRVGYVGRGVVFLLGGGFLVRAALRHDPESGVGLDAALQELLEAPFGVAMVAAVGVGLILFGVHCAVEARYGR